MRKATYCPLTGCVVCRILNSLAKSKNFSIFLRSVHFVESFGGIENIQDGKLLPFFFFLLTLAMVFSTKFGKLFVSQNSREFYASHSVI